MFIIEPLNKRVAGLLENLGLYHLFFSAILEDVVFEEIRAISN